MSEICFEYRGEKVTYSEYNEQWTWDNRSYPKPDNARKAIDRMHDGNEPGKPKFKRRKALFTSSYLDQEFVDCEVTSESDSHDWNGKREYWITRDGRRSRESEIRLYADTKKNREKLAEHQALGVQIENLSKQRERVKESMQTFTEWLQEQEKIAEKKTAA